MSHIGSSPVTPPVTGVVPPAAAPHGGPPAAVQLMWNTGMHLIEAQLREASAVDGKVAPLLGLTAAALGLVLAQHQALGNSGPVLSLELLVVFMCLLMSYRVQAFRNPPDFAQFLRWANASEDEIREQFLGNLRRAYVDNRNVLASKTFFLSAAVWTLGVVVVTVFVFIMAVSRGGAA